MCLLSGLLHSRRMAWNPAERACTHKKVVKRQNSWQQSTRQPDFTRCSGCIKTDISPRLWCYENRKLTSLSSVNTMMFNCYVVVCFLDPLSFRDKNSNSKSSSWSLSQCKFPVCLPAVKLVEDVRRSVRVLLQPADNWGFCASSTN